MAVNIPAALLNKIRPSRFRAGGDADYFETLERIVKQLQDDLGSGLSDQGSIEAGFVDVASVVNGRAIKANADDIEQNNSLIASNSARISQSENDIRDNADDIGENEALIMSLAPMLELSRRLINGEYDTILGSGDPNVGAVVANYSLQYADLATPSFWMNTTVGATSGWVQIV